MPRNKEWRQLRHSHLGKRKIPGAPVPSTAQQTASEDSLDIPGFYYDSAKKRYFKISNDFKVPDLREDLSSTHAPSVESFSKIVMLRQQGLLRRPFQAAALECKLKGLKNISSSHAYNIQSVNSYTCEALLSDAKVDVIAGVWRDVDPLDRTLTLSFVKGDSSSTASRTSFAGISLDPSACNVPFGILKPRDSFMVLDSEDRCLILNCYVRQSSIASMLNCSVHESSICFPQERTLSEKSAVFSCTYNRASQRAAFGMEKIGLVYTWDDVVAGHLTKVYAEGNGVYSTAFDSSGNILYCGSRKGKVFCGDLRCDTRRKCTYKITLKQNALRELRVLNDNARLVVSGDENQLLSLDLRGRRPLVTYENHVNKYMKIPFTVDENLGVLCSVGQDCRTRLWDLDSGRLMGDIESPVKLKEDEIPSAVFKSTWGRTTMLPSVVMGCRGKMYIYHV